MVEELDVRTPYRQARVEWTTFSSDLSPATEEQAPDRDDLLDVLRDYLEAQELEADWDSIEDAPSETLINSLAMICPFEPKEKQALLEAGSLNERARTLLALMEFSLAEDDREEDSFLQ